MDSIKQTLFLEINRIEFIFFVMESDEHNHFKVIYEFTVPLEGIDENRVVDSNRAYKFIKENVYLIEQKLNITLKEVIIILDNFNPTFINLSGFKKLNGSQILRENITYILNSLKSYVDKIEIKKTILHIFNSNFFLDNKKIENLPIGLFGDFYSHELSFNLIGINDYKNLENIFSNCNLKMKKILLKNFIKGVKISKDNKNLDTFFFIRIEENNSKIFFFENGTLKNEQIFKFGSDIVISDISKVTSLNKTTIKKILNNMKFDQCTNKDELIDKSFFENGEVYKKIKKGLIYEISYARLKELGDLILFKNINFEHYNKSIRNIFIEINNDLQIKSLKNTYSDIFSMNSNRDLKFAENLTSESLAHIANELVHFGWKKEAIPVANTRKSFISRVFDQIFK